MRKNIFISLSIIYVFTTSCSKVSDREVVEIVIDVGVKKDLNYSDIFESYEVIPLQTTNDILIGEIGQVIIFDELIFIRDEMDKSVMIFHRQGDLISKIHSEGMGPGELYSPRFIALDEMEKELVVLDGKQSKYMFFDFNGNFLREIKNISLGSPYDLAILKDNFYLVDGSLDNISERLKIADADLKVIKSINVFRPNDFKWINGRKLNYFYRKFNGDGFFYKEANHNRIIEINNTEIFQEHVVRFSSNEFVPKKGKVYQAIDFNREFWRSEQYAVGDEMIDSKDFALLEIAQGSLFKLAIWDKKNKSIELISKIKNDMDGIMPPISGIPQLNKNPQTFIWAFNPRELEMIQGQDGERKKKLFELFKEKGIEHDDNPILFIYKLKDSLKY